MVLRIWKITLFSSENKMEEEDAVSVLGNPERLGISIWFPSVSLGLELIWEEIEARGKSYTPKLDSKNCYVIINHKQISVPFEEPKNDYEIFFWIGSQSGYYHAQFTKVMNLCRNLKGNVAISIEYQYNESPSLLINFAINPSTDKNKYYPLLQYVYSSIGQSPKKRYSIF